MKIQLDTKAPESRIVAACKQNMPEIIRREMANYLNKPNTL